MELNEQQAAFRDVVEESLLDQAREMLPYNNAITVIAQVAVNIDGEMFGFQVNTQHNHINLELFPEQDDVFEDTPVRYICELSTI